MHKQVEGALSRLLDMANADPNNVPVLLAMATGGGVSSAHIVSMLLEFYSLTVIVVKMS